MNNNNKKEKTLSQVKWPSGVIWLLSFLCSYFVSNKQLVRDRSKLTAFLSFSVKVKSWVMIKDDSFVVAEILPQKSKKKDSKQPCSTFVLKMLFYDILVHSIVHIRLVSKNPWDWFSGTKRKWESKFIQLNNILSESSFGIYVFLYLCLPYQLSSAQQIQNKH